MVLKKKEYHSRVQHAKFSKHEWGAIETKLDHFGQLVLDTLAPLGSRGLKVGQSISNSAIGKPSKGKKGKQTKHTVEQEKSDDNVSNVHGLHVCGEKIYLSVIRPKLKLEHIVLGDVIEISEVEEKKKQKKQKKTKGKKGKTKEEIRFETTLKRTGEAIEDTLRTVKRFNRPDYGFNSQFVEIRISTLMYCASTCLSKDCTFDIVYELIVGMLKALDTVYSINGISPHSIIDLKRWISNLSEKVNFNAKTVFYNYPRLLLATNYDHIFPKMAIKPYKSQIELMDYVKKYCPTLIFYNAMIGSGKTTSVVPLVHYCRALRIAERAEASKVSKIKKGKMFTQVIFCCSVEPVRHQVANLAYNAGIMFGIATVDESRGGLKIRNNFACHANEDRELIVADLLSTYYILMDNLEKKRNPQQEPQNFFLFIDEPTVSADIPNDPLTKMVVDIISIAPERTILSSATMPPPEEIPEIVQLFTRNHEDSKVVAMQSKEALIGCEVISVQGHTISPHTGCITVKELGDVLDVISKNSFLGRLYTAPIVYRLNERLHSLGFVDIPDLDNTFENVSNLSQIYIQDTALEMLRVLHSCNDDELVKKGCGLMEADYPPSDSSEKDKEVSHDTSTPPESTTLQHGGFSLSYDIGNHNDEFDITHLFTKNSLKYTSGCLIAVCKPLEIAEVCAAKLFETLPGFSKMMRQYESDITKFNANVEKLKNSIRNEDTLTQRLQNMEEREKPKIQFPNCFQINTREHVKMFSTLTRKESSSNLRSPLILENIPFQEMNVPDWVLALLFAGVGIYQQSNPHLSNARYIETVLELTAKGKLAYLIADDNICYGANYPFYHVLIEDQLGMNRSMKTIFQLMGRAGRVGKSWTAKVHLMGTQLEDKIMNYVHGRYLGSRSEEADNLAEIAKGLLD